MCCVVTPYTIVDLLDIFPHGEEKKVLVAGEEKIPVTLECYAVACYGERS